MYIFFCLFVLEGSSSKMNNNDTKSNKDAADDGGGGGVTISLNRNLKNMDLYDVC